MSPLEILIAVLGAIWLVFVIIIIVIAVADKRSLGSKLVKHMTIYEADNFFEYGLVPDRLKHIADKHYANKRK